MHPESAAPASLPRVVNAVGSSLHRAGLVSTGIEPEELLAEARQQTGLADFGPGPLRRPLEVLSTALREEATLSFLGQLVVRGHLLRLLDNRLRLEADRQHHAEIGRERIERPLVILGLPRSGTTFLHRLLAQDADNRVPRSWEVLYPSPPPGPAAGDDPRIARSERQMRWFTRLAPDLRAAHPVGARLPQECVAILSHSLMSPQFHITHHIPSYKAWLEQQDWRPAYACHYRFLQQLQWRRPGRRWVLKAPAHLFALGPLLATYPDAVLVHGHRDPCMALASAASLIATLRRAFSTAVDPALLGNVLAERWAEGLERAMAAREAEPALTARTLDLRYTELTARPIAVVRRIYEHWAVPLRPAAEARMQRFLAEQSEQGGHRHRYAPASFGLERSTVEARFAAYRARYGIEREARAG